MKRNILNSPHLLELKKKRRRIFVGKILLYVFGFLVVFIGLVYLSRISIFNIKGIEIIGNSVIDTKDIETIIQNDIAGNYFHFFPKTNILFYPKNKIVNDLAESFKRLKEINLTVSSEKILQVSLTERQPKYTWCGETISYGKDQKCNFLDEAGFIFDEAPYFSGEVYFKFYGALPKDFAKFISFKQTLETMGLKPVALYVESDEDMRIFLSTKSSTSMGPEIIFNSSYDLEKTTENLQTALTTEPLQSNFRNKFSSLLYIDLRYGNKVVYKFN